jgi:hypothetical protein
MLDTEILNCILLPILAYWASFLSLSNGTYDEASAAWLKMFFPYRLLEGFWRILYIHLTFAAIALAATARSIPIIVVIMFIVIVFGLAALSQRDLDDEIATQMTSDRREVVIKWGIVIGVVYVVSVVFVVIGVITKPA